MKLHSLLAASEKFLSGFRQVTSQDTQLLKEPTWCIDYVNITEETIEIRGWAVHPRKSKERGRFFMNGKEFLDSSNFLPRPDIEHIFWWIEDAGQSGFCCKMSLKEEDPFKTGFATFSYGDPKTGRPFREEHNWYYLSDELNSAVPIPDGIRRTKVHGGEVQSSFLLEGFSAFKKLDRITSKLFNKSLKEFGAILDWGCGCGRLTRYFHDFHPKSSITGIDIDSDNIQWCQKNLPFGSFSTISPTPPTQLEDGLFDLIIGISIFTHLQEKDEFLWLKELKRLSAPGGILLMTVHGMETVARSGIQGSLIEKLLKQGFLDGGLNSNLDSLKLGDYYRNTFHTHDFLKQTWGEYFTIIDIIPGYIGNHQDLVVLQNNP